MSVPEAPGPGVDSLTVAGVVHDVNQMLTVITGRAGLLLNQDADPRWEPHLRAIALASNDAAEMLRRLSVVATKAVPRVGTELRSVVEEAMLLVWPATGDDYRWSNEVPPGLVGQVAAHVLREVLANLILNAVAVMPAGGEVFVRASGDPQRVQLRLVDSGPGLPEDDRERVFELGVTNSGEIGRGVGLAHCRQLLAQAGGQLTAKPRTDGPGAVFELDLPAGVVGAREVSTATDAVPAMDVLIVDDETVVREMLGEVLGSLGCRVQACRDGQAALAKYTPGTATVALIDRNLPGISGVELASRLRGSDPYLSIVLMTGWQDRQGLVPADPAIVDQEVEKPLAINQIGNILRAGYQRFELRRSGTSPA